ncbi:Hypothetical protein NCDO2118_2073 [Lactococcus lactis subsp. lactis NCDO 2118]|jgi:hypothetical protein|uniref:Lipoprotein n=1 Tax=Lactococcus lactis subsp. lactis NCDO 2118 TaxID=1117941 RepID=A0ABC8A985_LACLL|nr:hypothetical protein [Lactococcus lactis]ADA65722.1 Hypothetical protein LLKF_2148 [Lactococcus lactis subsp. lactis KF147]AII13526.1 Hypothetical protein NCDO2118_2073 [Lactococcus lactis subsp. lactis NCDO 2118]
MKQGKIIAGGVLGLLSALCFILAVTHGKQRILSIGLGILCWIIIIFLDKSYKK